MRIFGFFVTSWGAFLLGVLDASLVFYMPFGIDALVIYLAARDGNTFWIYPLLATAGSVTGAALTFWVGYKAGEVGLERLVPAKRLEQLRHRARERGAVAMAVPAIFPPPFPVTPFVLASGALAVSRPLFFATYAAMRLLRFSTAAVLAHVYGQGVLRVLHSDAFRVVVAGFIVVAVVGTAVSAVVLWRSAHRRALSTA